MRKIWIVSYHTPMGIRLITRARSRTRLLHPVKSLASDDRWYPRNINQPRYFAASPLFRYINADQTRLCNVFLSPFPDINPGQSQALPQVGSYAQTGWHIPCRRLKHSMQRFEKTIRNLRSVVTSLQNQAN